MCVCKEMCVCVYKEKKCKLYMRKKYLIKF